MEYRPYTLLNASELSEIERQIAAACDTWAAEWFAGDEVREVVCRRAAEFDMVSLPPENEWICMSADSEYWAALACSSRLHVGASLIPGNHRDAGGKMSALTVDLAQRALEDLARRLTRVDSGSGLDLKQSEGMPSIRFNEPGSGAVAAEIVSDTAKLVVIMSGCCVAAKLTGMAKPPSQKPLFTKPADALGNSRLKLNVLVGEAQLELALLQTIVVGDVIKLGTRLDEPLHVVNADGVRLCRAFLGTRNGRKSIQLIK